jgi:serine/threonine protein kinase
MQQGAKESESDPLIGKSIKNRYQILRKLGQGGMGSVYLAEQVSIGRKVALKLLRGNYAHDEEFIARFRREARLAASLNHPNIVTTYDFDQGEDGALFIAMEYIDGIKLSELIRSKGALAIERAIWLAGQIAEGLNAAHRAGVIHRDIKPDNIMVSGEDEFETIKLMDFGIARLRDTGTTTRLTRPDTIMGTPAYMAPEQAEGAEVSDKTDIYSFGIVMYEMLSGTAPFKGSRPAALLVKQIQEAPTPLRVLREEIPESIERVVMQALEKKPEHRQRNMREVANSLRGQAAPAPIKSVTPPIASPQPEREEREQSEERAAASRAGEGLGNAEAENLQVRDEVPGTSAATSEERDAVIETRKRPAFKFAAIGVASLLLLAGVGFGVSRFLGSTPDPEPATVPPAITEAPPISATPAAVEPRPIQRPPAPVAKVPVKIGKETPSAKSPKNDELPMAKSKDQAPTGAKVQDHIRVAKFFRGRGEYGDARAELEKARALDPGNKEVRAELDIVRRACEAERKILGRPDLRC